MAKIITDLSASKLRILVYGNAGTGKTRFAGSAALFEPTAPALMLTIGGNPISLQDYPQKPVVIEIESLRDFNDVYDWLYQGQPVSHPYGQVMQPLVGAQKFLTLIIDGATEVNNKVWRVIMGRSESDPDFAKIGGTEIDPRKFQDNLATMAYWGSLFFELAAMHNKHPLNVIVTALEREPAIDFRSAKARAEGADGPTQRAQKFRPAFIGQAGGSMESYAYIPGRMGPVVEFDPVQQRKLGVRKQLGGLVPDAWNVMVTVQSDEWIAKDQYGKLGGFVVDPTVAKIWERIYGRENTPL